MDHLWAPWRTQYVSAPKDSAEGCFLCSAATTMAHPLAVARDAITVTLLNRFPYNTGHLMVAPHAHVADLIAAGDEVAAAMMMAARRALRALAAVLHPDGFNIGVNQGDTAGASVEHVHLHVVPRWTGDTNFMPVVGGTKVLPERLEDTAVRVRQGFAGLS